MAEKMEIFKLAIIAILILLVIGIVGVITNVAYIMLNKTSEETSVVHHIDARDDMALSAVDEAPLVSGNQFDIVVNGDNNTVNIGSTYTTEDEPVMAEMQTTTAVDTTPNVVGSQYDNLAKYGVDALIVIIVGVYLIVRLVIKNRLTEE